MFGLTASTPTDSASREDRPQHVRKIRGGPMRAEYIIFGAITAFVSAECVSLFPDFVRYIKIRSMLYRSFVLLGSKTSYLCLKQRYRRTRPRRIPRVTASVRLTAPS